MRIHGNNEMPSAQSTSRHSGTSRKQFLHRAKQQLVAQTRPSSYKQDSREGKHHRLCQYQAAHYQCDSDDEDSGDADEVRWW